MNTLYLTYNDGSIEIIKDIRDIKVYSSQTYIQGRIYFWFKEHLNKDGYKVYNGWSYRSLRNISKVEFDLL